MKFEVTPEKIIIKFLTHSSFITADAKVMVNVYNPLNPRGTGDGGFGGYVAEIIADRVLHSGLVLPIIYNKNVLVRFKYYKELKELINKIKENNFTIKVDLYKLEELLSKPIEQSISLTENGIEILPDPGEELLKAVGKHGIKFFIGVFIAICLLLALAIFFEKVNF